MISTVGFENCNSLFLLPLLHLPIFLFSLFHTVFCLVFFSFAGLTSSEAITLAAARQWPEISKEPGQAASTAGKAAPRLIS